VGKLKELLKNTNWQRLREQQSQLQQSTQHAPNNPDIRRNLVLLDAMLSSAAEIIDGADAVPPDVQRVRATRIIKIIVPAKCFSFIPGAPNECRVTLSASDIEEIIKVSLLAKTYGFKSITLGFDGAEFCLKESGKVLCGGQDHDLEILAAQNDGNGELAFFRVSGSSPDGDVVSSGVIDIPTSFEATPDEAVDWLEQHYRCAGVAG
jgi:hypothetical protein